MRGADAAKTAGNRARGKGGFKQREWHRNPLGAVAGYQASSCLGHLEGLFGSGIWAGHRRSCAGADGNAHSQLVVRFAARSSRSAVSTIGYVNVERGLPIVTNFVPPELRDVANQLELQRFRAIGNVAGLDADGCLVRRKFYTDGNMPRSLDAITTPSVSAETLSQIPADANLAVAFNLDLAKLFDTVVSVTNQVSPNVAQRIQTALAVIGNQLKADIRRDLFDSLGPNWVVYNSPSEGGTFMTGLTAVIDVKNEARLTAVLNGFVERVRRSPSEPQLLVTNTVEGNTVYSLTGIGRGVPLIPSWALAHGRLWVSLQPQSLRAALDRTAAFTSLASAPSVKGVLRKEPEVLSLQYSDSRDFIQAVYPLVPYAVEAMINRRGPTRRPFDVSALPSLPTILRHIGPRVSYSVQRSNGVERVTHGTLPGGHVATVAPVGISLMLPAVQAARAAARRASSMNNMRQIAIAVFNYESTKGRLPAAGIRTKDGALGLSWRVAILPYMDERALYEKFHLDEPWDSDHNKALIADMPEVFRSPNSHLGDGEKTNYLAIRSDSAVLVDKDQGIRIRDITDGTSRTVLAVEVDDDHAVTWTKPDDLNWTADTPRQGLKGLQPGGFPAVFVDGHVQWISTGIDVETLRALFTRNGNERITDTDLAPVPRR